MPDFASDFPILSSRLYLNTASTGLLPKVTYDWRRLEDERFYRDASTFRDGHKDLITELRQEIAEFFFTNADNVALLPNFSFGFNTLLDSISSGLKVLLLQGDYPSVNWAVEHRDFQVCYARIDLNLEENIRQAVRIHKPDLFAFSVTQYISGHRLQEEFLQELKRSNPQMLLIADGTQYLGTRQFDFDRSPLDAIGASGYKWLLSGFGNGFFLFKPSLQKMSSPKMIGYNSADAVQGDPAKIPFFGKFEPGHQDTLVFGSMLQSLRYLKALGMDFVQQRVDHLAQYTRKVLAENGLIENDQLRLPLSPIIHLKGTPTAEQLAHRGIICSQRGDGLRLSFHFYNREQEIDRVIEAIKDR